jgi:hypothetical protein
MYVIATGTGVVVIVVALAVVAVVLIFALSLRGRDLRRDKRVADDRDRQHVDERPKSDWQADLALARRQPFRVADPIDPTCTAAGACGADDSCCVRVAPS